MYARLAIPDRPWFQAILSSFCRCCRVFHHACATCVPYIYCSLRYRKGYLGRPLSVSCSLFARVVFCLSLYSKNIKVLPRSISPTQSPFYGHHYSFAGREANNLYATDSLGRGESRSLLFRLPRTIKTVYGFEPRRRMGCGTCWDTSD